MKLCSKVIVLAAAAFTANYLYKSNTDKAISGYYKTLSSLNYKNAPKNKK